MVVMATVYTLGAAVLQAARWLLIVWAMLAIGVSLGFLLAGEPILLYPFGPLGLAALGLSWLVQRAAAWCEIRARSRMGTPADDVSDPTEQIHSLPWMR